MTVNEDQTCSWVEFSFFKMHNASMIPGCNVCGENHDTKCCPELGLLPAEIQSPATTK